MQIIGVDWGSSNRRAYLLDEGGELIEKREDRNGVLTLAGQDFGASLRRWLGDWLNSAPSRVWLTGMVGSRMGWQEVPYLQTPLVLEALQEAAVEVGGEIGMRILPGLSQGTPHGRPDVMRGEEAQLLGAWHLDRRDGWHVLPGTHSKWVRVEGGTVRRFRTFMTGELYAQLRQSGTLAATISGEAAMGAAFDAGLRRGYSGDLTNELFSIRAAVLLGEWKAEDAASLLSGVLIGHEWAAAGLAGGAHDKPLAIVASPALAERYARAAELFKIPITLVDPDTCYLHALRLLANN